MDISFELAPDDYRQVVKRMLWHRKYIFIPLVLISGSLAGIISILLNGITLANTGYTLLFSLGFMYSVIIQPQIIKSRLASSPDAFVFSRWIISADRIKIISKDTVFLTDWRLFSGYLEIEGYYLLRLADGKSHYYVIPQKAFPSSEKRNQFEEFIKEKIIMRPADKRKRVMYVLFILVNIIFGSVFFISYFSG